MSDFNTMHSIYINTYAGLPDIEYKGQSVTKKPRLIKKQIKTRNKNKRAKQARKKQRR
jgi:hypothetical protein